LRAIYDRYRTDFEGQLTRAGSQTSVFMSIDVPAIADSLGVTSDSVFGRLYHHLDPLYAPESEPGKPSKHLFSPVLGDDANCINFPMLEAVLAGLWEERNRNLFAVTAAGVSLGVAIASLIVSILW
jgi:hypothetical protein